MPAGSTSLKDLWQSVRPSGRIFGPDITAGMPEPARRYLEHAIAPGVPLASAVRLRMHGEIRLKGWYPFIADQVIRREGDMLWQASVRLHGMAIEGVDRLIDGHGEMRWGLFGIVPLVRATGADVTRSAAGRIEGESVWLPSLLCASGVTWASSNKSHACAGLQIDGESADLHLSLADNGRLESIAYRRWGDPDGSGYHYADFGGYTLAERTFAGYTIPTQMRVGWRFGSDQFESEGEFFRVTIDNAEFR